MARSTWLDGLEIMLLSGLLQCVSTVIACIGHSALAAVLACDCYSGYVLGLFCLNIFDWIMFTVIMFPQWIRHNNMSCVFCVGVGNLEDWTSHIDGMCDRMEVLEIPPQKMYNRYWVLETRDRSSSSISMFILIWYYSWSLCVQLWNHICRIYYNLSTITSPLRDRSGWGDLMTP